MAPSPGSESPAEPLHSRALAPLGALPSEKKELQFHQRLRYCFCFFPPGASKRSLNAIPPLTFASARLNLCQSNGCETGSHSELNRRLEGSKDLTLVPSTHIEKEAHNSLQLQLQGDPSTSSDLLWYLHSCAHTPTYRGPPKQVNSVLKCVWMANKR